MIPILTHLVFDILSQFSLQFTPFFWEDHACMVNKFFDLLDQFDQVDKWLNSSSNCFDTNLNVPEFPVVVLLPMFQCFGWRNNSRTVNKGLLTAPATFTVMGRRMVEVLLEAVCPRSQRT